MTSNNKAFLEEHKDFVLKIKIREQTSGSNDGAVQIRRVLLPRIADSNGCVSYEELVGLVLTFTFPSSTSTLTENNYQISLTYVDEDDDAITIGSTNELIDAIEQFSGQNLLRITAEVKPRVGVSSQPPQSVPKEDAKTSNTRQDRGTSTRELPSLQPQIHNVLEAFVGVLATAVSHLQDGLSDNKATSKKSQKAASQPDKTDVSGSYGENSTEESSPCAPPKEESDVPSGEGPGMFENKEPSQPEESHDPPAPTAEKDSSEACEENFNLEQEVAKEEQCMTPEPRPFIHGRHTCDSCLVTPIVGKRYHANNLPDYDLCEKCFRNYKGTEVQFESVELDRDRAFQERWHRRRNKIESFEAQRACSNRGGRGRRFGKFHGPSAQGPKGRGRGHGCFQGPACPPPPPHHMPPPPHGPHYMPPPPPHGPHHMPPPSPMHGPHHMPPPPPCPGFHHAFHQHGPPHWAHIGPHVSPHLHPGPPCASFSNRPETSEFDNALKEAIRRSLVDVCPKETDTIEAQEKASKEGKGEEDAVSVLAEDSVEKEIVVPPSGNDEEEILVPPSTDHCPSICVETVASSEHSVTVVDAVVSEEEQVLTVAEGDIEEAGAESEDKEIGFEDAMETSSVDSEKMAAEEESDRKPPAIDRVASVASSTANESFASDAVGSGDVAEAMGATLDMVVGVISEMLFEADSHNKEKSTHSKEDINAVESVPGALIVSPVEDLPASDEALDKEDNDWHVVKGTGSEDELMRAESEFKDADNDIARAAEMLGSALFNSDMRSSEDNGSVANVSTLSDSFSVPSIVPSISAASHSIAAAQRTCWASQLSKLSELGFDDESLCVDILERLKAANIGVESDDDVSVTQVVNALLEEK